MTIYVRDNVLGPARLAGPIMIAKDGMLHLDDSSKDMGVTADGTGIKELLCLLVHPKPDLDSVAPSESVSEESQVGITPRPRLQ